MRVRDDVQGSASGITLPGKEMVNHMTTLNDTIQKSVAADRWQQEIKFSVFVQPDKDFYLSQAQGFVHKYQVLRALAKHLKPKSIIELGVLAGAGAEALLSGVDFKATYHGFDWFEETAPYMENGEWKKWDRHQICLDIFKARNFEDFKITKTDLRDIDEIPTAEFVVVDAAHDYRNCYWDLRLAMTAKPKHIYIDDFINEDLKLAVKDFVKEFKDRIKSVDEIEHISGGCLITLK